LQRLGKRLLYEFAEPISLVVCGGSALNVLNIAHRTTRDVDVLAIVEETKNGIQLRYGRPLPKDFCDLVAKVGHDLGLPDDWLNMGPKAVIQVYGAPPGMTERWERREYGPSLTVYFVSRLDQVHFKLLAAADPKAEPRHLEDLSQRIRPTAEEHQDNVGDKAVLGAIASWMTERDKSMKWRGLAQRTISAARSPKEPLFRAPTGKAIRRPETTDGHFRRYGLVRETVRTRGMTQAVNMKDPVNIMFRSRAVFGIGLRADVMAYMTTTEGAHPRDVARTLGYNHMRVQEMLAGLACAGVAEVRPVGRSKQYRIDRDTWQSILTGKQATAPQWVNWRALTRGLTSIWREVWAIDEARADEYIFSSKMRSAMQAARNDLLGSGMGFAVEDDKGYMAEAYLPVFMRNVDNLVNILSDRGREAS